MNHLNEIAEQVSIVMPRSVVRTISLEKFRRPSPLAEQPHNCSKEVQPNQNEPKQTKKMYEKILDRKLSGKVEQKQNKEKVILNGRNIVTKKFEELRQEVDIKEMKECTFKPAINPSDKNNRNVDKFFNDQLHYVQHKNDKVEEMRIILENNRQKENIFRPNTMLNREKKGSVVQDNQPVHERLYQDSKNKDKHSEISRQESNDTLRNKSITSNRRLKGISRGNSSEKIGKSSNRKLSVASSQLKKESTHTEYGHLSSELSAMTTRKASAELHSNYSKEVEKARKESKPKEITKRVDVNILQKRDNTKNQEIYIGKLMKEIAVVITKCNLPLVFSYMEMNLFLEKMNFVSNNNSSRKHLYEIWNMLQGEIYQEVSALSVIKIVYAIMGCHNVNSVNRCITETWLSNEDSVSEYEQELKKQGKQLSFKQNLLMLSDRDSKTLKQCYEELHLNRMKKGESELLKEQRGFQYSFKPSISKNTTEYAEKYRNRMLCQTERLLAENKISYPVPENGEIDHIDLLMLDKKRQQALLVEKREQQQKEKRRLEDESLTTPNYTERERDSNKSAQNLSHNHSHRDRNHELFEMGKLINQTKKDKSADEVEEEKWKNELTFKPTIKSKQTILQQLSAKQTYIPDYDKTIYRMQEARKSRDITSRPSTDRDESPLLYLNVMGVNQAVKVPVYREDSMKSITEKVRVMMDLNSQDDSGMLENILKLQIMPVLQEMNLPNLMHA